MKEDQKQNQEIDQILESYYRCIGCHFANKRAAEFDNIKNEATDIEYPQELDDWFFCFINKE